MPRLPVNRRCEPATSRVRDVAGLFQRLVQRRGAIVPFTIDGEPVEAREGDFLITAILLHRPSLRRCEFDEGERAGFCFMAACQDCWVELADGRRLRACSTPLEAGMAVVIEGARGG
jgi:predicted molibdopterin-dependent oxidoreductase YjgC